MSQFENEQSLSMFFDPDFNSSNYVDALFQSIISSNDSTSARSNAPTTLANTQETLPKSSVPHTKAMSSSTYNKTNLNALSIHLSNIVTHLDYYTNELTQELSSQIDNLKRTSTSVVPTTSSSAFNEGDAATTGASDITRLQYYINSFSNSIVSLNTDIETIKQRTNSDQQDEKSKQPISDLLKLKTVRSNLLDVLTVLERVNLIISTQDPAGITIDEFERSISFLYDTLKSKFEQQHQSPDDKQDLVDNARDLIDLLPLFQNLSYFYPTYKKFTVKLSNDLENYK